MKIGLTEFLAIWGSVLGTIGTVISIILAINIFKKDSRKIKIKTTIIDQDPFWIMATNRDSENTKFLVVDIYNSGYRPILIEKALILKFDDSIIDKGRLIEESFPYSLKENEKISIYFDVSDESIYDKCKNSVKVKLNIFDSNGKIWRFKIPIISDYEKE